MNFISLNLIDIYYRILFLLLILDIEIYPILFVELNWLNCNYAIIGSISLQWFHLKLIYFF